MGRRKALIYLLANTVRPPKDPYAGWTRVQRIESINRKLPYFGVRLVPIDSGGYDKAKPRYYSGPILTRGDDPVRFRDLLEALRQGVITPYGLEVPSPNYELVQVEAVTA